MGTILACSNSEFDTYFSTAINLIESAPYGSQLLLPSVQFRYGLLEARVGRLEEAVSLLTKARIGFKARSEVEARLNAQGEPEHYSYPDLTFDDMNSLNLSLTLRLVMYNLKLKKVEEAFRYLEELAGDDAAAPPLQLYVARQLAELGFRSEAFEEMERLNQESLWQMTHDEIVYWGPRSC
jgi:hypothetical protein